MPHTLDGAAVAGYLRAMSELGGQRELGDRAGGRVRTIWQIAIRGACPACGRPGMVWQRGLLDRVQMAPACAGCGQPFAADEAGGRGLYPVVLPLVVLMVLAALKIDDLWRPPLWVYPLVAAPVALVLVGGAVRLAKSAHLAAHVGRGAGQ